MTPPPPSDGDTIYGSPFDAAAVAAPQTAAEGHATNARLKVMQNEMTMSDRGGGGGPSHVVPGGFEEGERKTKWNEEQVFFFLFFSPRFIHPQFPLEQTESEFNLIRARAHLITAVATPARRSAAADEPYPRTRLRRKRGRGRQCGTGKWGITQPGANRQESGGFLLLLISCKYSAARKQNSE